MKATAINNANLKPQDGNGENLTLFVGEYVFGDYSSQNTDIINVRKVYNANGTIKKVFTENYKVFIGNNLKITNETEPTTSTDPDPEEPTEPEVPPTPVFPEWFILTDPQGNKAEYVFVRIIEES